MLFKNGALSASRRYWLFVGNPSSLWGPSLAIGVLIVMPLSVVLASD